MADIVIPPPERIKADVEHIKDWLSKEPHLAHLAIEEDEEWLESFLYNNKFSLEKTKYKLENLYSIRNKYPEIFKNRDPLGEDVLRMKNFYKHAEGQKQTKEGIYVVHIKLNGGPSDFDQTTFMKLLCMIIDVGVLNKKERLASYIAVVDYNDFKPGHLLKVLSALGTLAEIYAKVYTFRPHGVHFINLPTYAHTLVDTMNRFFPDKLSERVRIHSSIKTLFDDVEEDIVSCDFGGKGPSIAELQEQMQRKLEQARDWFQNQGNLCSNEKLRTKESQTAQEMKGSFRKLEVD